ncbi:MAG: recombinase family protein [Sphaerochaetaceae bacterium]
MKGQIVGYVRVSSVDQKTDRQLDGIEADRIYEDKASGKSTNRPQLKACLEYLRSGDKLVVWSIDRAARSLQDLQNIVNDLVARGVTVEFIKERLTFSPDSEAAPMDRLLFHILGAFAEFERMTIRERQREGIDAAIRRGKKFGRPVALTDDQRAEIKVLLQAGKSAAAIGRDFGVSRQTVTRSAKG